MLFGIVDFALWHEPGHVPTDVVKPKPEAKPIKKGSTSRHVPVDEVSDEHATTGGRLKAGDTAPEIKGVTVNGKDFSLRESLRGAKLAIVNFWFVSNDASKKEIGKLQDLYSRYRDQGLVVLGIDLGDREDSVRAYLSAKEVWYPNMLDTAGDGPVANYHILGFPCSVVIDSDGKVVEVINGFSEENLSRAISRAGISD